MFLDYIQGKSDSYLIKIGDLEHRIGIQFRTGMIYVFGFLYIISAYFDPSVGIADVLIINLVAAVLTMAIMKYTIDSAREISVKRLLGEHLALMAMILLLAPSGIYGFLLGSLLNGYIAFEIQSNPAAFKYERA